MGILKSFVLECTRCCTCAELVWISAMHSSCRWTQCMQCTHALFSSKCYMLWPYCTALSADVPGPVAGEPTVVDSGRNWLTLSWPKSEVRGGAPVLAYRVEAWPLGGEGGARWIEVCVTILPVQNVDMRICARVSRHAALIAWHCTCSADFVYYQLYNLRKQDVCVCVAVSKLKLTAVGNDLSQHTHTHTTPTHITHTPHPHTHTHTHTSTLLPIVLFPLIWAFLVYIAWQFCDKLHKTWEKVHVCMTYRHYCAGWKWPQRESNRSSVSNTICYNRIIKCARRERIQRRGGVAPFILSFGFQLHALAAVPSGEGAPSE